MIINKVPQKPFEIQVDSMFAIKREWDSAAYDSVDGEKFTTIYNGWQKKNMDRSVTDKPLKLSCNAVIPFNLSNVFLSGMDLSKLHLARKNLRNSNLKNSIMPDNLRDSDLRGADVRGVDFSFVSMVGAKLTISQIGQAKDFDAVDLNLLDVFEDDGVTKITDTLNLGDYRAAVLNGDISIEKLSNEHYLVDQSHASEISEPCNHSSFTSYGDRCEP